MFYCATIRSLNFKYAELLAEIQDTGNTKFEHVRFMLDTHKKRRELIPRLVVFRQELITYPLKFFLSLSSDHKVPKFDSLLYQDLNICATSFPPKLAQLFILPGK